MILNSKNILFVVVYLVVLCKSDCPKNFFKLKSMTECHPLLTCEDVDNIQILLTIGYGAVKNVYLAVWRDHHVAYSVLKNPNFQKDFNEGLTVLQALNPSPHIVQLVGYCKAKNIIITEYHQLNNGNNFKNIQEASNPLVGLKMCLSYVQILHFIHASPIGVRVNCDSNSLEKLLSQLLITNDLSLVLNDVDALPEVTANVTVKCGPADSLPPTLFVPPEQSSRRFVTFSHHIGYTDRSDVWKVPHVCNYFLQGPNYNVLQYSVFSIHKKCQNLNPNERPTSAALISLYTNVLNQFVQSKITLKSITTK